MLARMSGQVGFFDAVELARPLPEGSFFALLAEHGDRVVRDEDFAACYSERMGCPSIPPSQLAKVLLLQYRTGCSDEQAMECGVGSALEDRARAGGRRSGLASDVVDEVPRPAVVA